MMAKRAWPSSSSGQPSQPKRPCLAPADQVWNGSERNLVLGSCSTEGDGQRVCVEEPERAKSHSAEYCQSCTGNALKDIVQWMHSMDNSFQKLAIFILMHDLWKEKHGRTTSHTSPLQHNFPHVQPTSRS